MKVKQNWKKELREIYKTERFYINDAYKMFHKLDKAFKGYSGGGVEFGDFVRFEEFKKDMPILYHAKRYVDKEGKQTKVIIALVEMGV
jgi:hypothetical protein